MIHSRVSCLYGEQSGLSSALCFINYRTTGAYCHATDLLKPRSHSRIQLILIINTFLFDNCFS